MKKTIKTKKRLIKPKLHNKPRTAFRVGRDVSIKRYINRKAELRDTAKGHEEKENPNHYAVDTVEKAADTAVIQAHTHAKKILHYAYHKYKANKYNSSSNRDGQDIPQRSPPARSVSENKSAIKTKDYYIRRQEEKRANISRHSPLKGNQSEAIKAARKNTIKNKVFQSGMQQKNHIRNAVKKRFQQLKQKAQMKMSREAVQRSVQATKAVTRLTMKLAQITVAAAKALVSAILALGGGAMLLVVLLIIIVVAAVAASPFGIFISEETNEGIPISAVVAECNQELTQKIEEIEDSHAYDREEIQGEQADWAHVLVVFSVKTAGTDDNTAKDVVVIDETKKQLLKDVFWDMNPISSNVAQENGERVLHITIGGKTSNDMITQYNFSSKQQEALATLLENSDILLSAAHSLMITDASVTDVLHNLPQDLSPERKAVVKAACSLVGKVNYFWGGKSSAIGWDSNWGKMMCVTAARSSTTGTIRPYGLDCSGFVSWAFINAGISGVGSGTQGQNANSTRISWSNTQAGDLAFYNDLSHVGIIVGKDSNGNILVIHCNSSANNVSLTTNSGFGFSAIPNILD